jgi:hypothetical protein
MATLDELQLVKPLRKSFWNRFFNAVKVRIREGFYNGF